MKIFHTNYKPSEYTSHNFDDISMCVIYDPNVIFCPDGGRWSCAMAKQELDSTKQQRQHNHIWNSCTVNHIFAWISVSKIQRWIDFVWDWCVVCTNQRKTNANEWLFFVLFIFYFFLLFLQTRTLCERLQYIKFYV